MANRRVPCENCGNLVVKTSRLCPICRSKNPNRMRNYIGLGMFGVLALIFFDGASDDTPTTSATRAARRSRRSRTRHPWPLHAPGWRTSQSHPPQIPRMAEGVLGRAEAARLSWPGIEGWWFSLGRLLLGRTLSKLRSAAAISARNLLFTAPRRKSAKRRVVPESASPV